MSWAYNQVQMSLNEMYVLNVKECESEGIVNVYVFSYIIFGHLNIKPIHVCVENKWDYFEFMYTFVFLYFFR